MKCVSNNRSRNFECIFNVLGCKGSKGKCSSFYSEVFHTYFYIILQCLQQKLLRFENRKCQDPSFPPNAAALNPQNAVCICGSVYTGTVCLQLNLGILFSVPVDWFVTFTRTCMFQSNSNSAWTSSLLVPNYINKHTYIDTYTCVYAYMHTHD